jgi:DNA repair ATPase RecN
MSSLEDANFMALCNELSAALHNVDDLKAVLDVLKARVEAQENEIAEYKAKTLKLIIERDRYQARAEEQYYLRREISAALNIEPGDGDDKALEKALKTIRELQKAAKQQ